MGSIGRHMFAGWLALASCAALSVQPAAAAYVINTGPSSSREVPFGAPNSATYGETFVVPGTETLLTSFTMYLGGSDVATGFLNLRGYVAGWDGNKATSILYTSDTLTVNIVDNQVLTFAPSIGLTTGSSYVAFLSISELPTQANGLQMTMPDGDNSLGFNSKFVYFNNGTDFSALTTQTWNCDDSCLRGSVLFQATLTDAPEPTSLAILTVGLGAVLARRRSAVLAPSR